MKIYQEREQLKREQEQRKEHDTISVEENPAEQKSTDPIAKEATQKSTEPLENEGKHTKEKKLTHEDQPGNHSYAKT